MRLVAEDEVQREHAGLRRQRRRVGRRRDDEVDVAGAHLLQHLRLLAELRAGELVDAHLAAAQLLQLGVEDVGGDAVGGGRRLVVGEAELARLRAGERRRQRAQAERQHAQGPQAGAVSHGCLLLGAGTCVAATLAPAQLPDARRCPDNCRQAARRCETARAGRDRRARTPARPAPPMATLGRCPELPDVTVYLERLSAKVVGHRLERVRIGHPFLLRSVTPPIAAVEGQGASSASSGSASASCSRSRAISSSSCT